MKKIFFLLLFFQSCDSFAAQIAPPQNFNEAKKYARIIWAAHRVTFYCGCDFDGYLKIDHKSCGYDAGERKRAYKVEWEHLLPASSFGKQRKCWQEKICKKKNGELFKGRHCCEKMDKDFKEMVSDLHNLVPAIGEVNAARRDYRFSEFILDKESPAFNFHGCNIGINRQYHTVEPKDEIKGFIARAHLYMAYTYSCKLDKNQLTLFARWNKAYPPSPWEMEWDEKVRDIQGSSNLFISQYFITEAKKRKERSRYLGEHR